MSSLSLRQPTTKSGIRYHHHTGHCGLACVKQSTNTGKVSDRLKAGRALLREYYANNISGRYMLLDFSIKYSEIIKHVKPDWEQSFYFPRFGIMTPFCKDRKITVKWETVKSGNDTISQTYN